MSKSNSTPDLDDEQYMEQLYLLVDCISVMPGAQNGMPDVTTPPPIRARWAAYLLSLGLRIDPELATHQIRRMGVKAAGGFSPKVRTKLGNTDLAQIMSEMSPMMYEKMKKGEITVDDLRGNISDEVLDAVRAAGDAT